VDTGTAMAAFVLWAWRTKTVPYFAALRCCCSAIYDEVVLWAWHSKTVPFAAL